MAGNIRLKSVRQEGKDYTEAQCVRDSEGFEWCFGENQTLVLPDTANRTTLASNATVDWGTTTQQLDAPSVVADIAGIAGRS
jgi:hypothetical protein